MRLTAKRNAFEIRDGIKLYKIKHVYFDSGKNKNIITKKEQL